MRKTNETSLNWISGLIWFQADQADLKGSRWSSSLAKLDFRWLAELSTNKCQQTRPSWSAWKTRHSTENKKSFAHNLKQEQMEIKNGTQRKKSYGIQVNEKKEIVFDERWQSLIPLSFNTVLSTFSLRLKTKKAVKRWIKETRRTDWWYYVK